MGDDSVGRKLLDQLSVQGIEAVGIVVPGRPTTLKTRIMVQHHLLVRTDQEESAPLPLEIQSKILQACRSAIPRATVVVISDYAKGVVSHYLAKRVIQLCCRFGKICLADPKGTDFRKYRGVTVITPNLKETELATGIRIKDEASLHRAGQVLLKITGCRAALITQGKDGVSIFRRDGKTYHLPAMTTEVFDVTGAGDTLLATLASALASGYTLLEASFLANIAAGLAVRKLGTASISFDELRKALLSLQGGIDRQIKQNKPLPECGKQVPGVNVT